MISVIKRALHTDISCIKLPSGTYVFKAETRLGAEWIALHGGMYGQAHGVCLFVRSSRVQTMLNDMLDDGLGVF